MRQTGGATGKNPNLKFMTKKHPIVQKGIAKVVRPINLISDNPIATPKSPGIPGHKLTSKEVHQMRLSLVAILRDSGFTFQQIAQGLKLTGPDEARKLVAKHQHGMQLAALEILSLVK